MSLTLEHLALNNRFRISDADDSAPVARGAGRETIQ